MEPAAVKKPHPFPWLLAGIAAVAGAAAVYFLVRSKKCTLNVTLGPGVSGTPAATNRFRKGKRVAYEYSSQAGYGKLQVKLDGVVVAASGTVVMNGDHALDVSATRQFILTVNLGAGTSGTPAASASYNRGQVVAYGYAARAGYDRLQVKLDGADAAASGTVTMNADHALAVSAVLRPNLASLPYASANDVRFYRRFEPEHGGIDLSATREITILAMCAGTFSKKLYYHPTSLRWQVNAEIVVSDYTYDCLFEPGAQVSRAVGQAQFDALVPEGTVVKAGDVLGKLLLAPGNSITLLHFGVRWRPGGTTYCPLDFSTAMVRSQLQALARRDHPGWTACVGN